MKPKQSFLEGGRNSGEKYDVCQSCRSAGRTIKPPEDPRPAKKPETLFAELDLNARVTRLEEQMIGVLAQIGGEK